LMVVCARCRRSHLNADGVRACPCVSGVPRSETPSVKVVSVIKKPAAKRVTVKKPAAKRVTAKKPRRNTDLESVSCEFCLGAFEAYEYVEHRRICSGARLIAAIDARICNICCMPYTDGECYCS